MLSMELIALTFMTQRVGECKGLFHFKGAWLGKFVTQLELDGVDIFKIQKEIEYVLHLSQVYYCHDKKLIKAKIVKARALST